jgi:uncharacterized protein YoxC
MSLVDWVAIIAICAIVATVGLIAVAIGIAILAWRVSKSVGTLTNKAQPLISQAKETVMTANGIAQTVKDHAEGIKGKAEDTVETVTRKVKTTSELLQESVSPPIITLGSVIAGVTRGLEVLGSARKRGGNGHEQRQS